MATGPALHRDVLASSSAHPPTPPSTAALMPDASSPNDPSAAPESGSGPPREPDQDARRKKAASGESCSDVSGPSRMASGVELDDAGAGERSCDSSIVTNRHGARDNEATAPDQVAGEATTSMSQPASAHAALSPNSSLRNLSPHSRSKPVSPISNAGLRGPQLWGPERLRPRSEVSELFDSLSKLKEPNTISGDALQGALDYGNVVQVCLLTLALLCL
jgi:hypothetical protein